MKLLKITLGILALLYFIYGIYLLNEYTNCVAAGSHSLFEGVLCDLDLDLYTIWGEKYITFIRDFANENSTSSMFYIIPIFVNAVLIYSISGISKYFEKKKIVVFE